MRHEKLKHVILFFFLLPFSTGSFAEIEGLKGVEEGIHYELIEPVQPTSAPGFLSTFRCGQLIAIKLKTATEAR